MYIICGNCRGSVLGNGCTLYVVIVGSSVLGKWVYIICGSCRGAQYLGKLVYIICCFCRGLNLR